MANLMHAPQPLSGPCPLHLKPAFSTFTKSPSVRVFRRSRRTTTPRAVDERQMFGDDFGARDPTAGEIASNFTDKVLGNADTSHIIRGPKGLEKLVGLATRKCVPCENGNLHPLSESAAYTLRNQVPGWRLEKTDQGSLCLRQEWKVKDSRAGDELIKRIGDIAEAEGHRPEIHMKDDSAVAAELSTHAIGGLSENDFIMAAKINNLPMADLQPKAKQRFWA